MKLLFLAAVLWLHSVQAYEYQEYELAPVGSALEQLYFNAIDLNGDGLNEVVFVDEGRDVLYSYDLSSGLPTTKKLVKALDCYVWAISVSDFNQDDFGDLTILCYQADEDLFYIKELHNLSGSDFQLQDIGSFYLSSNYAPLLFDFHDIDADGDLDVSILGSGLVAWVQNDTGEFALSSIDQLGQRNGNWQAGQFVDVDDDGDLDVVASTCLRLNFSCLSQQTKIYFFDENMNEFFNVRTLSENFYGDIKVADMDQDGILEILVNSNDSQGVVEMIKFQQPEIEFINIGIELPGKFSALDINHDQRTDLIGLNEGETLLNAGQLSFTPQSLNGSIKLINDLNGDELMDVIIEKNHPTLNTPYLYLLTQEVLIFKNGFETIE